MSRVKVTINKKGYIPSLGLGPIRRPILITEELYEHLLSLGYPVEKVGSSTLPTVKKEETPIVPPSIPSVDEVTETTVDVKDDEPAVENEDELTTETIEDENAVIDDEEKVITETEEETVEILQNDPDLSAGAYYTEDFLTSKVLCKKILSAREVQYDNNASWSLLKQLVLESNPEVEFVD